MFAERLKLYQLCIIIFSLMDNWVQPMEAAFWCQRDENALVAFYNRLLVGHHRLDSCSAYIQILVLRTNQVLRSRVLCWPSVFVGGFAFWLRKKPEHLLYGAENPF